MPAGGLSSYGCWPVRDSHSRLACNWASVSSSHSCFWIGSEIEGVQYRQAETAFFSDILTGVVSAQGLIDRLIDKALAAGWPLARIDSVMRAIVRAGAYELKRRADIPARVSIKEYVDIAGAFFGSGEAGMINAVLDALARQCRAAEFEPRG